MRKMLLASLLIAGCSRGPKAPALTIEITRLGLTLDATGWVVNEKSDFAKRPTLVATESPERFQTFDDAMGSSYGTVRRVTFGPFPKGSGLVTMESLEISSTPLIDPAPSLEKCGARQLELSKMGANEYHLRVPQAPLNLHGIDALIWEDEVNFLVGAGPNLHRILVATQKGTDCLLLEAAANVPNYDKVQAKLHKTLETLAPLP